MSSDVSIFDIRVDQDSNINIEFEICEEYVL